MTDSDRVTPSLYSCSIDIFLPIFNRLWLIRLFHIGWEFPIASVICGVFRENDPKKSNFRKTRTYRGHFLTSNRVFWAMVRENRFTDMGCTRGKERKNKQRKMKLKGTRPRYSPTTWGRHRWYDPNQIQQDCWSAWRYHSCQIWKQTIHNCDFGKRLIFTI